jgi:probable HAF family extracellular repeat protein
MQDLGTLGGDFSQANAVSANGQVVVGVARNAARRDRAFRWENGVMQDLGTLGGDESHALGVSANGQVVVGWAQAGTQERAFRWENGVMQDLNQVYAQLVGRSVLLRAYAISPDGRYIVGVGFNASTGRNEAFLLDTGPRTFQISGRLELRDFGGDVTQVPIRMELRQGGTPVRTETIYLNANGDYVIPNVENGTYDLAFKASHWLRVVVAGIKVRNADVSGVDASLTNGDIDGDNEVTLVDFGALVVAFGSLPGDTMWNPEADLDGDGEVTLLDFGILVRNFGTVGDE